MSAATLESSVTKLFVDAPYGYSAIAVESHAATLELLVTPFGFAPSTSKPIYRTTIYRLILWNKMSVNELMKFIDRDSALDRVHNLMCHLSPPNDCHS